MNEELDKDKSLIDTTDCLEAVGVFRAWKNGLFFLVVLCLVVLQAAFWLVNTGYVKTAVAAEGAEQAVAGETEKAAASEVQQAAKEVAASPNEAAEAVSEPAEEKKSRFDFGITVEHLRWLIRFFNFVLIPAAILYCLTMLFSLKVSFLGRLGGINHIARAFFLSLVFVVLLLPWQRFFGGVVAGAMYTPQELLNGCVGAAKSDIFSEAWMYLRFSGYWLLVLLLVIFSQIRSARWTKTILRRLEII